MNKIEKIKKLADAMYNRMQNLTTDTSGIRKAMDEYHQFIINEYYKENTEKDLSVKESVISFGASDSELIHQEIFIPEGFEATIDGNKIILTRTEIVDDEIRKELLRIVKENKGSIYISLAPRIKSFLISLLEKKGGQNDSDVKDYNSIDPHFGKPNDKIEPKFHEGDWVVDNIGVAHKIERAVLNVTNNTFGYDIVGGGYFNDDSDVHLWTIQDAKAGDVLCCESGWTCVFKTLNSDNISFSSYCFMDKTGWFCETGSEGHTLEEEFIKAYNGEIKPATKEQRNKLEKAMTNAGYTFDFEKKELKKIEQKSINENLTDVGHEYYSKLLSNDDSDNIDDYAYQCAYCMSHDWMKEMATWEDVQKACKLGAEWKKKHRNNSSTDWSEEDRDYYDAIITKLEVTQEDAALTDNQMNFLKSLKDRVQPKPKREWSVEDMSKVQRICKYLDEAKKYYADITDVRECMNWLKSLKERIGGKL